MYTEERPNVTFADVASNEEAKEDLQEIIDYLRQPSRYAKVGARIPHGVLLSGPPGTGKTLMARAVAGEAKVPFLLRQRHRVRGDVRRRRRRSDSRPLREGEEDCAEHRLRERDRLIGRQRSSNVSIGGNDEREQTLNQLLVEMDGFEANQSVIVIAANQPAGYSRCGSAAPR